MTTLSIIHSIISDQSIDPEFDGRLPETDQRNLMGLLYECRDCIREALWPLLNQRDFHLAVIGAEIDDESESLWVFIDDPDNPL